MPRDIHRLEADRIIAHRVEQAEIERLLEPYRMPPITPRKKRKKRYVVSKRLAEGVVRLPLEINDHVLRLIDAYRKSLGSSEQKTIGLQLLKHSDVVTSYLTWQLKSEKETERGEAARAIGQLELSRALPELVGTLQDRSTYVQACAAIALGKFGTKASSAIPLLQKCVTSETPLLQQAAREALARCGYR